MKKIFAANWKLQKTPAESADFADQFLTQVAQLGADFFSNKEVFIFPQSFSLDILTKKFSSSKVLVGPQTIHFEKSGAFTGENSAELSQKMGAQLVLLGHSERRQYFHETNQNISKKIILSQSLGLLPVLCIGETLAERENNQTEQVCFQQLTESLSGVDPQKRIVIAYEPVWAIGTGKVATVEQVAEIHSKIDAKMKSLGFKDFQILYGGSVKPENATQLIALPHVDGFLIGGASLEAASFLKICLCI